MSASRARGKNQEKCGMLSRHASAPAAKRAASRSDQSLRRTAVVSCSSSTFPSQFLSTKVQRRVLSSGNAQRAWYETSKRSGLFHSMVRLRASQVPGARYRKVPEEEKIQNAYPSVFRS